MLVITTTNITILTIGFILGFITHLFLSRRQIALDKRIAILILGSWMGFAMIAYLQERELSIFFNSAGLGAVGNLLGIKTGEFVDNVLKRK